MHQLHWEGTSSPEHTHKCLVHWKPKQQHTIICCSPSDRQLHQRLCRKQGKIMLGDGVSHPTAVPQPSSSCPCPAQAGLPALTYMVPRGNSAVPPWATLRPLLQVACLCVGQAKDFHRVAPTSRHLHLVPKDEHCRDLLFTFLFNKLSPIIALALELKASGVMNNCYF